MKLCNFACDLISCEDRPANRNDDEDADPNDGGYWNIQLSPTSISSVPFGPGHITVWEHADAPGR